MLSRGDKITNEILDIITAPIHRIRNLPICTYGGEKTQLVATLRNVYREEHVFAGKTEDVIYRDIVVPSKEFTYSVIEPSFVISKEQCLAVGYAVHRGLDYRTLLLRMLTPGEIGVALDAVCEGYDLTPFINANLPTESLQAILDGLRSGISPQAFARGFYKEMELIRILKTLRDARILRYSDGVINLLSN
jgi:hypothetical protein